MAESDPRTRIREAALERFGRQGIRETSTREILRAAGMKNPSAITYHFGSKANLVEDLITELRDSEAPVIRAQIDLAAREDPPTIEAWTAIPVDSSVRLISTERGCLLIRLWSEYHNALRPDLFEEFLGSGSELATEWLAAVEKTFTALPHRVAVTRNLIMLRMLEWIITRRATRLLVGKPAPAMRMEDPEQFRTLMLEVAVGILSAPTSLGNDAISFDN